MLARPAKRVVPAGYATHERLAKVSSFEDGLGWARILLVVFVVLPLSINIDTRFHIYSMYDNILSPSSGSSEKTKSAPRRCLWRRRSRGRR